MFLKKLVLLLVVLMAVNCAQFKTYSTKNVLIGQIK